MKKLTSVLAVVFFAVSINAMTAQQDAAKPATAKPATPAKEMKKDNKKGGTTTSKDMKKDDKKTAPASTTPAQTK